MTNGVRRAWLLWGIAIAMATVYAIVVLRFYNSLEFDTAARYAVMAEEFANGNFHEAFHPRFGILIQVVAGGIVCIFGVSGFEACQIFAVLGWCLSIVPLWYVFRETFDERAAWWAIAVVLVIPMYFKLSGDGMRDNMRMLSVALCALGFLRTTMRTGPLWMAIGVFTGVTLRADAVVSSAVMLAAYVGMMLYKRSWRSVILPGVAFLVGFVANCVMVFHYTGVFVPFAQAVKYFR